MLFLFTGVEAELRERITSLEHNIEEQEKQKRKLLHDFDAFKDQCADTELALKSASEQKVAALSKELQHYQQEFETKTSTFEELLTAFEQQKEQSIEELKRLHQIEVSNLLKAQQSESSTRELQLTNELEAFKAMHAAKVLEAESDYNNLKAAKNEMEGDYIDQLRKAKLLYEKELELLERRNNDADSDTQKRLQEKIDRLTKDIQYQEVQHKQRVEGLLNDLSVSEDLVNSLRVEISSLTSQNSNLSNERVSLLDQVCRL